MSLAVVYSRAQTGIDAPLITVEVHLANGLPTLSLVGLPETVVRESKDRVRAALLNARFEFPVKRITISLAPANLPKGGSRFDLAIALGILAASKQIPKNWLEQYEFIGDVAHHQEIIAKYDEAIEEIKLLVIVTKIAMGTKVVAKKIENLIGLTQPPEVKKQELI